MSTTRKERRRFKRIYFTKDTGITGIIHPIITPEKASPVSAKIMNLSAEGAELCVKRTDGKNLDTKYHMTLEKIAGCKELEFCTNIEFEIKRIVDIAALDNIILGCYFHGLSKSIKSKINAFVIVELDKQK